jgi:AmiR/NasT family two-component response regulator
VARLRVLDRARVVAEQLDKALTTRAVIDHAIGILMSRIGCSAEEAFERLRTSSRADNMTVTAVSDASVQQAVQQAVRHPRRDR